MRLTKADVASVAPVELPTDVSSPFQRLKR